jgi:hypothetical protein
MIMRILFIGLWNRNEVVEGFLLGLCKFIGEMESASVVVW